MALGWVCVVFELIWGLCWFVGYLVYLGVLGGFGLSCFVGTVCDVLFCIDEFCDLCVTTCLSLFWWLCLGGVLIWGLLLVWFDGLRFL